MGCYSVFFFIIAIFLVICCQKHIPLLHSALYCLHPLHSRFIQSFFVHVLIPLCSVFKVQVVQKCYRNSSTGSILAIFSWFLYWKMCDRLATIRIWCYTCSCSGNSIDSLWVCTYIFCLNATNVQTTYFETLISTKYRSLFFVSNYITRTLVRFINW